MNDGFLARYLLTSDIATSKTTGNVGAVFMGWPTGLPDAAHQLILSRSADEIIDQRIFFLPHERHLFNDKLHNDVSWFGKEIGLIPVYLNSLPSSENVRDLHSAKVNLPMLSAADQEDHRRQLRKVKHSLMQLLSATKESAQSALNDFVFEIEELIDICKSKEFLKIQIYVLEFPKALKKDLHVAFVIQSPLTTPDTLR